MHVPQVRFTPADRAVLASYETLVEGLPAIVPFMSVFVFIGVACTGLSPLAVAGGTIYAFALFATLLVSIFTGWGRRYEGAEGEAVKEEPAQVK